MTEDKKNLDKVLDDKLDQKIDEKLDDRLSAAEQSLTGEPSGKHAAAPEAVNPNAETQVFSAQGFSEAPQQPQAAMVPPVAPQQQAPQQQYAQQPQQPQQPVQQQPQYAQQPQQPVQQQQPEQVHVEKKERTEVVDTQEVKIPAHTTSSSIGLFILRLVLGLVMIVHAYQKYFTFGLDGTADFFASLGIPNAETMALVATAIEGIGGLLLILGLFTRIAALALAGAMAGAAYYAHFSNGFYNTDGGYEYTLVLVAALLAIMFLGAGRWSVDGKVAGNRKVTVPQN